MRDSTRVYTEGGTVAHILDYMRGASPNNPVSEALCGRTPWPALWHGTGTQEEEERALDLRVCTPCQAILAHRRGGFVTR